MRIVSLLFAFVLAGSATPALAADRIFADGFEPCCTLGGEVVGLTGSGLVLHLVAGVISGDNPVNANGGDPRLYTFAKTAPPGTVYTVTITTQPASQICTVSNASGTMATAPVDDITVACVAGVAGLNWDDGSWDEADWQ